MNTAIAFVALVAPAAPPEGTPAPAQRGKVLVLDNERTLSGDIERVGSQYRLRRSVGETWVPAERVLALCDSVADAYQVLRRRANLRDPDEHLRLAQWCRLHELPEQALAEVEEAVRLRPEHAESRRLLRHLQQAALVKRPPMKPAPAEPEEPGPPPAVDLTDEALGQFASKVQPILMNTCAGCHATGKGGAFKLTRTYDGQGLNRRALQYNLAAVLAQVNAAQPLASPVLTKAVSVHGEMAQSPLKSRQAAPYRTLEEWVRRTVADNPQLGRDAPVPAPAAEARPVPTTPASAAPPPAADPPTPGPAPQEEPPTDPFDPAAFNRQAFPGRTAPPPPK